MPNRDHADLVSSRSTTIRRTVDAAESASHPLIRLQRQLGNQAVSRLLAQREKPVEGEEELLQAKHDDSVAMPEVGLEGGIISAGLTDRIQSKRGGGMSLDESTRGTMENAFGSDFSDVRLHVDDEADSLNRSVSARAFTTGTDIFFSRSASPSDSSLLAHELAHVVQQRGSASSSGPMTVSPAGDAQEHQADAAASAAANGSAQRLPELMGDTIAREELPEDEELGV